MKNRSPKPSPSGKARQADPQIPLGRKILFSLVGFVVLPLLALVLVELVLRMAGVGYSPAFFRPLTIQNERFLVENDKFGLRFFPKEMARTPPPLKMKASKEPGAIRIFLLGESAVMGDPRPAYGVGRYLQALLEERFPGKTFEVIPAAVTAVNSHAVREIANECARHDGDLWIVYMGNNEMVGPFGATTVFGSQSPPLYYVRLSLAIQSTRIGQLIMALGRKLAKRDTPEGAWGGMQMWIQNRIQAEDKRKEVVYKNFRANLESILKAGLNSRAQVILSTVAVNLKDCAPLASLPGTNLPAAVHTNWSKLLAEGIQRQQAGQWADAEVRYREAAALDPKYAEVLFRLGTCELFQTNSAAARTHFVAAMDCDALPFRTDTRLNTITRDSAHEYAGNAQFAFLDVDPLFATNSPAGSPGAELFYEHVHFNPEGNYLLARAWAEMVANRLPASITTNASASWASPEQCHMRIGFTDWNRFSVLDDMLGRMAQPPFTGQSNHTNQLQSIRARIQEIRSRTTTEAAEQARTSYQKAIARSPADFRLQESYAEFLELRGDLAGAAECWESVRKLIPHHHVAYVHSGRLAMRLSKLPEAEVRLKEALAIRPDLAEAWLLLGQVYGMQGRTKESLQAFQTERRLAPGDYRVYYFVGKIYSKQNRGEEAIAQFRESLRLRPAYWEAKYALAEELAFSGQTKEARALFEEALLANPNHAMTHLNLGVALTKERQLDQALYHFEETLRLSPTNQLAIDYMRQLRKALNK